MTSATLLFLPLVLLAAGVAVGFILGQIHR